MSNYGGPGDDYVEVSERIREFREKHPDGSLQSEIVACPFDGFVAVKAYAYRTPTDERPGTGLAWEPVPGGTPFTEDTELMNAETSAWGRALIAVGAADAKKGVASASEVRNRSGSGGSSSSAGRQTGGSGGGPPACGDCGEPITGPCVKRDGAWIHKECPGG